MNAYSSWFYIFSVFCYWNCRLGTSKIFPTYFGYLRLFYYSNSSRVGFLLVNAFIASCLLAKISCLSTFYIFGIKHSKISCESAISLSGLFSKLTSAFIFPELFCKLTESLGIVAFIAWSYWSLGFATWLKDSFFWVYDEVWSLSWFDLYSVNFFVLYDFF